MRLDSGISCLSRIWETASSWIHSASCRPFLASSISEASSSVSFEYETSTVVWNKSSVHNRGCVHACMEHNLLKHRNGDSSSHDFLINHLLRQMRVLSLSFQFLLSEKVSPRLVIFLFLSRERVLIWFDLGRSAGCLRFDSYSLSWNLSTRAFLIQLVHLLSFHRFSKWQSVQTPSRTCPCGNTCSN